MFSILSYRKRLPVKVPDDLAQGQACCYQPQSSQLSATLQSLRTTLPSLVKQLEERSRTMTSKITAKTRS